VVTKALAEEKRAAASRACWQAVRAHLKAHRPLLTRRAAHHYRDRLGPGGLIVPDGWLPSAPVPLDEVELVWRDRAPAPEVDGSEPESEAVRPLLAGEERYGRYSDAMADLARPQMFEDRPCYRLLDVDVRDDAARLAFGRGSYFGLLDVCEAVAHEAAGDEMGERTTASGNPLAFRTLVGDPADLARRSVVPGISVLTIRQPATGEPTFLLHRLDSAKVAHAGGMVQVLPVGVFQPSGPGPANERDDFDLLHSIARELSEELLGEPKPTGHDQPIDYDAWPFYARLRAGTRDGQLRLHWLGLGIDPLSLAVDMLVVAMFDDQIFDTLFDGKLANINAEGLILGRNNPWEPVAGIPFTGRTVVDIVQRQPLQAAAATLLLQAWRHRRTVLF
jgi:hypothetical protein